MGAEHRASGSVPDNRASGAGAGRAAARSMEGDDPGMHDPAFLAQLFTELGGDDPACLSQLFDECEYAECQVGPDRRAGEVC